METIFRLRFLGTVQIERNGKPVRGFRSRKALAILGYLAVQNQPTPREQLADLFWEDKPEATGRANLSWTLNKLSALLPDCLQTDRHTVQFQRTDAYWLDVDAFAALEVQEDVAALAAAVELARGEFMSGLDLDGCAEFGIWLVGERERWRQRVARVLDELVTHHSRRGEYAQSVRFAQHLLTLEPWREETHRQVMRLLARNGQRETALAQYLACRRVLAEELGIEPTEETTALYERIRAAATHRHTRSVPPQPTPFVGRQEELAALTKLLDNPDHRLVTIVGPGGIGKTRLALQAAAARAEAFLEGICFVSLAPVSSAEFLISAIADALQFSFAGRQDPRAQLFDFLRGREMLLVLDNMEHLLEGTTLLAEILEQAPQVKLLVTSRERLNLRWEWCFEIEGLEYPVDEATSRKEWEDYGAVQLFQQTVRQAHWRFSLSSHERSAVLRICQLVEGMPLGIELTAAWVGSRTCEEIAQEIQHDLGLLATSMRDVPERHRSVRATFEHSWRLLTPSEQDAFMRLSVFHGFQPAAAQEVVGATPVTLKSLTSKSLLRLLPSGRYEMHELLRQYAAEKLAALPEAQTQARDRHCAHYAASLQRHEAHLTRASMMATLAAIRFEIGNIHAAWRWAVAQARWEEIERSLNGLALLYRFTGPFQEAEMLVRIAVDRVSTLAAGAERPRREVQIILSKLLAEQARFLDEQGLHERAVAAAQATVNAARTCQATDSEAAGRLRWGTALLEQGNNTEAQLQLEQALTLAQGTSLHQVEAHCLRALGDISANEGDYVKARVYYEQSLRLSREFGDPWSEGGALNNLGNVALQQGDYTEARAYYEQALQICREIGDRLREAITLCNIALVLHFLGDYAQAGIHYKQAVQVSREIGNRRVEGYALTNLGNASFEQGNYAEAWTCLKQALHICRETGNRLLESLVLNSLGLVCTYLGDYANAQAYFEPGLRVCREIGERRSEGMVLSSLGLLSHRRGDDQAACEYGQQALHIAQELGERRLMGYVLCRMGYALMGLGRLAEAADAYERAQTLRREMGQPNLAMEPLAGLACVALAQGDLPQARRHVAEILEHLETGTLDGTDEPCQVYLTCYRVLRAAREDSLAQAILSKAHSLLQEWAARISDEGLRRSFLENVAAHREIVETIQVPV